MNENKISETTICFNRKRTIIDMGEFYFVYIPLDDNEKKQFCVSENNYGACWRIRIIKNGGLN